MNENASLSGEIITFYSYKGGTGRSMALANVAYLLSKKIQPSEKILLIDWDLEAPGLHQFFRERFVSANNEQIDLPSEQKGLIDLFYEIKTRLQTSRNDDVIPEGFFHDLSIQNYLIEIGSSPLILMPAGKFGDGLYSARVNEFSWAEFFSAHPTIIPQFAEYLRKNYRYVLIDSRTGYTDISGICTSIMPEKLVVAFTPNRQNLSGATELIKRAIDYRKQSDDLRQLTIFPLPSRIESAENKLQKEWRFGDTEKKIDGYQKQFEATLKEVYSLNECDLTSYFDEIQIQYIPRYSYGEEISVLSERAEDRLSIARSFEGFTEKITSAKKPWEKEITYAPKYTPIEQNEASTEQSRISRTQIIATILLLGFIGVITASLFNTSSPGVYLAAFGTWLVLGTFVDILKLLLTTVEYTTAKVSETLKNAAHTGRESINDLNVRRLNLTIIEDMLIFFRRTRTSLLTWATNFLIQVIEPMGNNEIADQGHLARREKNEGFYAYEEINLSSIFSPGFEYKFAGQKIIGAVIGFVALVAFLYADAVQGAQTYALLFPEGVIPSFLNNITVPIILASAGSALILGVFVGDILGLTHFGLFTKNTPRQFLWIISINLVLSIMFSSIIALNRIGIDNNFLTAATNIVQSIIIIPMLITTFLLFRGIYGIYVVLTAIILLLAGFFGIVELFTQILGELLRLSAFIITRTIWLVFGTMELLFSILELIIKGSFSVLAYILVGVFFIPNLLFRIILRVFNQDEFYVGFLKNLLSTSLEIDNEETINKDK